MVLESLGNLGDFLGGIGVVITLVYLATQIRQNTAVVRANGAASHSEGLNNITLLLARDAEARAVYFEGLRDYDGLAEDGKLQFDLLVQYFCQSLQRSLHLHREHAISEEAWGETLAAASYLALRPGFRRWWEIWAPSYPPEFKKFIDDNLASIPATNPPPPDKALNADVE
jgi:hypothetical protein